MLNHASFAAVDTDCFWLALYAEAAFPSRHCQSRDSSSLPQQQWLLKAQ